MCTEKHDVATLCDTSLAPLTMEWVTGLGLGWPGGNTLYATMNVVCEVSAMDSSDEGSNSIVRFRFSNSLHGIAFRVGTKSATHSRMKSGLQNREKE